MKSLFLLTLLFFALHTEAKNIYLSTAGNDVNTGLSAASPWKTIAKLNASFININAGDSILFKRGEVFVGGIIMAKNGTSALPIVVGAYGTGVKPVISYLTTVTNWTNSGGGIWKTNVTADPLLLIVTINNTMQRMGRYPNANAANGGWLFPEAANNTALTITDNELTGTPNWTGAEAVMRKQRWIIDRCKIKSQNGTTITYINPVVPGEGSSAVKVGWGYFFQNDIRTLDQFGEWYFNPTTKDLSIYFGTNNPTSYSIKVSTGQTLLDCGGFGYESRSNITIDNLTFEGADNSAILGRWSSNIKVKNCKLVNNYNGINLPGVGNSYSNNDSIIACLNNGIVQTPEGSGYATITNNFLKNIGIFSGMGGSGNGHYTGIRQNGNFGNVSFNRIDSIGYDGIEYNGSGTKINNNYISNFCFVKDDGGGIYTQGTTRMPVSEVFNNIVINGIGEPTATNNHAFACEGIYTDDMSNGVYIHHNTIANIQHTGIFWNGTTDIITRNNTIYQATIGFNATRSVSNQLLRNNVFAANIVYPVLTNVLYGNNRLYEPDSMSIQYDMRLIARFDSNYYRNDVSAPFDWAYHKHAIDYGGNYVDPAAVNLSGWKTFMNSDAKSKIIGTTATRFEFNPTNMAKTVSLEAKYLGVDSTVYNGTITLQPYTSAILLYSGAVVVVPPPPPLFTANAGKDTMVMLPANNTMLNGTANAAVASYKWTKIAGPTNYLIASSTSANTAISNLSMGKYTFQLKVKNAKGDSAIANINVTAMGTLPVKLLDFTAKITNDKINLQWAVAAEGDILKYAIERSQNGEVFQNIGNIQSNNLVDIQSNYNFADNLPFEGVNYYRLVMIEKSGKQNLSKTISVLVKNTSTAFTVENIRLSNGTLKIGINGKIKQQIKLIAADVSGRVLFTELLQIERGYNNFDKKTKASNTGIYYVKIFTDDFSITKSILATP